MHLIGWAPLDVTSCLTKTNRLDSYVESPKRGVGGGGCEWNKSNRLLRESPCNDVIGSIALSWVHCAELHLEIWLFNVSLPAVRLCFQYYRTTGIYFIWGPQQFGINSIVIKLLFRKHTFCQSVIPHLNTLWYCDPGEQNRIYFHINVIFTDHLYAELEVGS